MISQSQLSSIYASILSAVVPIDSMLGIKPLIFEQAVLKFEMTLAWSVLFSAFILTIGCLPTKSCEPEFCDDTVVSRDYALRITAPNRLAETLRKAADNVSAALAAELKKSYSLQGVTSLFRQCPTQSPLPSGAAYNAFWVGLNRSLTDALCVLKDVQVANVDGNQLKGGIDRVRNVRCKIHSRILSFRGHRGGPTQHSPMLSAAGSGDLWCRLMKVKTHLTDAAKKLEAISRMMTSTLF